MCALPCERLAGERRERQDTATLLRLGRKAQPLPPDVWKLVTDHDQPSVAIDVFPQKAQHLPAAEPETERQGKERPEPVVVRRGEEALRFVR